MQGFCNSLGLFQVNMTNPEGRSGHRRRGWEEEVRSSEMAEVKDEVYHRKKVSCVTYNDKPGNIAWYFYDPFLGVRFVSPSFSVVLLVKSPATWGLKSWRLSLSPWPSWWRKCWVTRYVFLKKKTPPVWKFAVGCQSFDEKKMHVWVVLICTLRIVMAQHK